MASSLEAAAGAGGGRNWLPIESNPAVMDEYLRSLGFPTEEYHCYDILSTDDWALEMIPRPVLAVLMLFPIKAASEAHREEEEARITAAGQTVDPSLYYMKQTIANACGTIGLIHAVANASTFTGGNVSLQKDSFFDKFLSTTLSQTPEERAALLETDKAIDQAHETVAHEGQSAVIEDTWQHFVAFVAKGGHLYELDGRKASAVNHGPTTPETLLEDASRVIREFMARDPEELRFTMVAIAKAAEDEGAGGGEEGGQADAAPTGGSC